MTAAGFDRLAASRVAIVAAFTWGLAEATVFFIVPDVLLMSIAMRSRRGGMRAALAALCGALIGGALMYGTGERAPREAEAFLESVPAISSSLVAEVKQEIDDRGLSSVMLGPMQGQPYKIYAVEWGARRGSLLSFLVISIPARAVRFILTVLVASFVTLWIARWTGRRVAIEMVVLVAGWFTFYSFYFLHFGW